MAFKSQAQKKKFEQMLKDGKIIQTEFDLWNKGTPEHHKLPERVKPAKPTKPKGKK